MTIVYKHDPRNSDLPTLVSELREGQAMLVQEREARQEFRGISNEVLDRIDRTLKELWRERGN